jgi:hypothetical protein
VYNGGGVGHCWAAGGTPAFNPLGSEGSGDHVINTGMNLNVSLLSVPDRTLDFANYETWLNTYTPQVSYGTWVEEGMTAGSLNSGQVGLMWFWADNRPNGGYNDHYINGNAYADFNKNSNVTFRYEGSQNWGVYLKGVKINDSYGNGSYGTDVNTGTEVTTPSAGVTGHSYNFDTRMSWVVRGSTQTPAHSRTTCSKLIMERDGTQSTRRDPLQRRRCSRVFRRQTRYRPIRLGLAHD